MHIGLHPRTDLPLATAGTDTASQPMPQVDQVPNEILDAWVGKFKHITLPQYVQVRDLLSSLSHGHISLRDEVAAQSVFNTLLQEEEFDVFADVFEAYNQIQSDNHPRDDNGISSFRSTLTLQLPKNWRPMKTPLADMDNAFRRIHVDRLVVMAPDTVSAVPRAVSECIMTLLKSGTTTEFVVHGLLHLPEGTADDTFAEVQLQSLELGGAEPSIALRVVCDRWMAAMAKCKTLKHLTLNDTTFVAFHNRIGNFQSALETVKLLGEARMPDPAERNARYADELQAFVQTVANIKTLSVLVLNAAVTGSNQFNDRFLKPLAEHGQLTSLEINGPSTFGSLEEEQMMLPNLLDFSITCPRLTHLKRGGELEPKLPAGERVNAVSNDVWPDSADVRMMVSLISHAMLDPRFKLTSLTANGSIFWGAVLDGLLGELQTNTTLEYLDVSGSYHHLPSLERIDTLFERNKTLKSILWPSDPSAFYMLSDDGQHAHGLVGRKKELMPSVEIDAENENETLDFELAPAERLAPQHVASALTPFAPLQPLANAMQERPRRREMDLLATTDALASAGNNVAHVMAAALKSNVPTAVVDGGTYALQGQLVARYLAEDLDLRTARGIAHMPEVNKLSSRALAQPPAQDFLRLLKRSNMDAAARDLPNAPLQVNEVDANGFNVRLLAAVKTHDVDRVRALIRGGAIDFGCRVAQFATSFEMAEALQSSLIVPTTTSTITTTSSTAISTHATMTHSTSPSTSATHGTMGSATIT